MKRRNKGKNKYLPILKILGINQFIAVKANYTGCTGSNFYAMVRTWLEIEDPEYIAHMVRWSELDMIKYYAQYQ